MTAGNSYLWGLVQPDGNIASDEGRSMIFTTRKEARIRAKEYPYSGKKTPLVMVRKVYAEVERKFQWSVRKGVRND